MLLAAVVVFSAFFGALGRRVAGGLVGDLTGHPSNHFLSTTFYGFTAGLAAFLGIWAHDPSAMTFVAAEYAALAAFIIGFNVWIGHILGLHESAGMGHLPPDNLRWSFRRYCRDFLGMLAYGLLSVVVSIAFILFCPLGAGLHWLPLLIAAISVPFTYTITWRAFWLKPFGWPVGFEPPLALAEPFVGGALAVGAALVG